MRVVNGARQWLICWAGTDQQDRPWKPSWEPTNCVKKELRDAYMKAYAGRRLQLVEVDARPLDTLVQRSIAQAAMNDFSSIESFGRVHEIEIGALSLHDLAVHYFDAVVLRFGLEPRYAYAPDGNVLTKELQIKEPEDAGAFCCFEHFMREDTGVGAMRYALGRKSNTDFMVVPVINMFFSDNKHTPGCVTFKVEFSTVKGNGATGRMTGPHLGERSKNPLKDEAYLNKVVTYARGMLPRTHTLIKTDNWHTLPPHIHAVR